MTLSPPSPGLLPGLPAGPRAAEPLIGRSVSVRSSSHLAMLRSQNAPNIGALDGIDAASVPGGLEAHEEIDWRATEPTLGSTLLAEEVALCM